MLEFLRKFVLNKTNFLNYDSLVIQYGRQERGKVQPGTVILYKITSEDHDRCFSILVLGAFSTGVFNINALPRINIGADVWGESSIMKR